jgi:hypothetical protein
LEASLPAPPRRPRNVVYTDNKIPLLAGNSALRPRGPRG